MDNKKVQAMTSTESEEHRSVHESIIESLRKDLRENVYFFFNDDDDAQYPDSIKVKIKRDEFDKFIMLSNYEFSNLNGTYKEYQRLTEALKKYNIPYEDYFVSIDY